MIITLFQKEFTLELRQKSVAAGLVIYLFSTAFICYLTFRLRENLVTPLVWAALFWITILFTLINSIAKSFIGEKRGREIYYYSIAKPTNIIISKISYNFLLATVLSFSGFLLFYIFLGMPIEDVSIFAFTILLTSLGFAASLTLLSSISAKASNSSILMAVLSFPVVISILLVAIKISKNCIDGLGWDASWDELLTLAAINCLVSAMSYLLFPYIWRS